MLDGTPLYIASGILFLIPCILLYLAGRAFFYSEIRLGLPLWRRGLWMAALVVAGISTLIHIIWTASWLHSGGSPNGMGAGPGIWESLGLEFLYCDRHRIDRNGQKSSLPFVVGRLDVLCLSNGLYPSIRLEPSLRRE
jgi:hypothetical protein